MMAPLLRDGTLLVTEVRESAIKEIFWINFMCQVSYGCSGVISFQGCAQLITSLATPHSALWDDCELITSSSYFLRL